MLTLSQSLSYYKRRDVAKLILEFVANKEIAVRYNEAFGKRPDTLNYENDILESARNGATSFHCSEELWTNPLQIRTGMKKNELDELRIGWDLILDIDCPFWEFAKIITYLFIKALKDHGINCIGLKFSGGKGFHIGVPFETFPKNVTIFNEDKKITEIIDVKDLFPDGPRKIAEYLLHYIENNDIKTDYENKSIKFGKVNISFSKFQELTGKSEQEMIIKVCKKCGKTISADAVSKITQHLCGICGYFENNDKAFMKCPKCNKIMERITLNRSLCLCGSNDYDSKVDLGKIVEVDTVLISSRHLYRMPYSLHEKTGLVSTPFPIKHILNFQKEEALPTKFKPHEFLAREKAVDGEASNLFQKAYDFKKKKENKFSKHGSNSIYIKENSGNANGERVISDLSQIEHIQQAIPEEYFPPCIKKISQGMQDGKKRALFILVNFLSSSGWEFEQIEDYIHKWNEKNTPDKLRETYVVGQLRYYKTQKEKAPPPNCDNTGYMKDTGFCSPDGLCRSIKNPVQYAKKKTWLENQNRPKIRKKKVSEEKPATSSEDGKK